MVRSSALGIRRRRYARAPARRSSASGEAGAPAGGEAGANARGVMPMGPVARHVPLVGALRGYSRSTLVADAVAGVSVWALVVPQCLAYATLAGVPVQYGLYTAFAALTAYALFGRSNQLVQGPSAAVCAVSAAVVTPIVGASALGSDKAVQYTAALALVTGVVYLVLGAPADGLGLDLPLQGGHGRLRARLRDRDRDRPGAHAPRRGGRRRLVRRGALEHDHADPGHAPATLAVGAGSLALLLVLRRFARRAAADAARRRPGHRALERARPRAARRRGDGRRARRRCSRSGSPTSTSGSCSRW